MSRPLFFKKDPPGFRLESARKPEKLRLERFFSIFFLSRRQKKGRSKFKILLRRPTRAVSSLPLILSVELIFATAGLPCRLIVTPHFFSHFFSKVTLGTDDDGGEPTGNKIKTLGHGGDSEFRQELIITSSTGRAGCEVLGHDPGPTSVVCLGSTKRVHGVCFTWV